MRRIKITEEISSDEGYSDAILTTFKFNSFFESDVLQALRDAGVKNVMVLIDETEFHQKYSEAREHEIKYYLEPVKVRGTFHPKVIVLIGSEKAKLIVTSANLTDHAYERNAELAISVDWKNTPEINKLFSDVEDFFLKLAGDYVSDGKHAEVIESMFKNVPCEKPEKLKQKPRIEFIHNLSEPIVDQIRPERKWEEIQVLSPFFDSDLSALKTLSEFADKTEVYLQNRVTNLPKRRMHELFDEEIPIYDVSFPEESQTLHAKAVLFNGKESRILFGSANASKAALEETPENGNVEACIARREKSPHQFKYLLENDHIKVKRVSLGQLETQGENPDERGEEVKGFLISSAFFEIEESELICRFDHKVPRDAHIKIVVKREEEIIAEGTAREIEPGEVGIKLKGVNQRDLIGAEVRLAIVDGDGRTITESHPRKIWNPYQKMLGDAERSLKGTWRKNGEDFLERASKYKEDNPTASEEDFIHLFYTYALPNIETLIVKQEGEGAGVIGPGIAETPPTSSSENLRTHISLDEVWNPQKFRRLEDVLRDLEKLLDKIEKPEFRFLDETAFAQSLTFLKIVAKEVFLREKLGKMVRERKRWKRKKTEKHPIAILRGLIDRYIEGVLPASEEQFGEETLISLQKEARIKEHLAVWWHIIRTKVLLGSRFSEGLLRTFEGTFEDASQKTPESSRSALIETIKDYKEIHPDIDERLVRLSLKK
ncbi:hypothetical protein AKJ45_02120 [candidate division MSBL1 archaeon SCGC-AAA261F19]|uniref:Phospholipase D-like domain-containing protein n=2 Tax=candidate division MSBL1 TaxID=215777 RepID=A0A133V9Y1_9EURY|nr:hypothetical protein AKJ43_02210 [candidate division MSBL1 archaeon SCGC-AAA261D19]KXB03241.1 hypothetical protein AKJ45_02120 [candidate division MSBL1 archaeon SCGC-AAA261F19]